MLAKCNVVDSPLARRAYVSLHPHCAACGGNGGLCCHHIIGGWSRSDEPCNFITLCLECHAAYHDRPGNRPVLNLANILWLKRRQSPDTWNLGRLGQLAGRTLPEMEPPV
jgi:hypothetical protein